MKGLFDESPAPKRGGRARRPATPVPKVPGVQGVPTVPAVPVVPAVPKVPDKPEWLARAERILDPIRGTKEVSSWDLQHSSCLISVHRLTIWPFNRTNMGWYVSCLDAGFNGYPLRAVTPEEAQREGIDLVLARLRKRVKVVEGIMAAMYGGNTDGCNGEARSQGQAQPQAD